MSDIWKKAQELREQKLLAAARRLTMGDIKPGVQLMHTGRKTVEMVEVIEVLKERGMSGSMPTLVKVRGLESHKTYPTEVGRLRWPDEDELVDRRGPRNTRASDEDPCWDGYEQVGMKDQDGKEVPNCVPKKEAAAIHDPWDLTRKVSEAVWALAEKLPDAGVSMYPNRVLVPGGARSPEGWFTITWKQSAAMGYAVMEIKVKPFDLDRGECSIEGFVDSGKRNVFTVVAGPDTVARMVKSELTRAWKQAVKDVEALLAKKRKTASASVSFEAGSMDRGEVRGIRVSIVVPLGTQGMSYHKAHNAILDGFGKAVRRWKAVEQIGGERIPNLLSGGWDMWIHKGELVVGWEGFLDSGFDLGDLRRQGMVDR